MRVCDCLKAYLHLANHVPENLLRLILNLCQIKMASIDVKVKFSYTELMKQVPVDVATR